MRLAALLLAALPLLAAETSLKRATFTPVEQSLDRILTTATADDPVDMLGGTRGIYLEGFGAVFTTEVALVLTPGLSPFRPKVTEQEIKRMHDRKLKRVPVVQQAMRQMLAAAASALDSMPTHEQIVVAVRFLYLPWEDTAGLPSELVVKSERVTLLKKASLESSIRTEQH